MTRDVEELPLFAWAARPPIEPPIAEVVDLEAHRAKSARWKLVIEPGALSSLDRLDKILGLLPATPIIALRRA